MKQRALPLLHKVSNILRLPRNPHTREGNGPIFAISSFWASAQIYFEQSVEWKALMQSSPKLLFTFLI
jgi:hypothetical protein